MDTVRIMIVEDDMIIAADLSMQLTNLGYEITSILARGEDVLKHLESDLPDLILMDIQLKGTIDGVQTAQIIYDKYQLPLIYLTANTDDPTFQRAKETRPFAFIAKPFEESDLERTIELVVSRLDVPSKKEIETAKQAENAFILDDRIFVKQRDRMIKIFLSDILYVAADRYYCKVFTSKKEYLMTVPLKEFEARIDAKTFLRVHRSYLVNITKIDAISDNNSFLTIGEHRIPVSRSYQGTLQSYLKLF
ncbi:MAG: LytTR family transcriptional regulator DNA-binding domain-containing protein [Bacteroidota bacterium]